MYLVDMQVDMLKVGQEDRNHR